jgi:predicted SAM-dependent methyltransferase
MPIRFKQKGFVAIEAAGVPNMLKDFIRTRLPFLFQVIKSCTFFIKGQLTEIKISKLLREKREIFVEVGAGEKKGTGSWVTIDITRNCDFFYDLRRGLPFPDGSVAKIYSSHFLEHLTFKESQSFLKECRRVLIPGGVFSICVPNAGLYIKAYLKSEELDPEVFFGYKSAYNNTTKIDYINYIAYMDGVHKYMFDEDNLLFILKAIGFKDVRLRQFDSSLDLSIRDFESIYAEAKNGH